MTCQQTFIVSVKTIHFHNYLSKLLFTIIIYSLAKNENEFTNHICLDNLENNNKNQTTVIHLGFIHLNLFIITIHEVLSSWNRKLCSYTGQTQDIHTLQRSSIGTVLLDWFNKYLFLASCIIKCYNLYHVNLHIMNCT